MKSKFVLVVMCIVISITASLAQAIPRNDFVVTLTPTSVSLSKGDTVSVQVSITRSKLFKRGTAVFGLSSPDKKGIAVTLVNSAPDSCILKISSNETVVAGNYTIVPNCTLHGKTIGSVLKLIVNP